MSIRFAILDKVQKMKDNLEKKEKAALKTIDEKEKKGVVGKVWGKSGKGSAGKQATSKVDTKVVGSSKIANPKNVFSVAKKEITSYLDSAAFYVVLVVFLAAWQFIFFRSVFLIGESSLNSLFGVLPWLFVILIPAVTMGSIAKEKTEGTIELVLTHPIKELELVLGKIFGALFFVFLAVLFSIPLALFFNQYGTFDWGVYIGQITSAFLLATALISLGVFVSTLFASQIATLLVAIGISFIFIISGSELVTISLPFSVGNVLERLSLLTHYISISRGVLDMFDILYFVLFSVIFINLAHLQLVKNKYGDSKGKFTSLQLITMGLIGFAFVSLSLRNFVPGRLDLTQGRAYTLSNSTKKVLSSLEEPVKVILYVSEKIPAQYNPILREAKYTLNDYKIQAGDKIIFQIKDPSKNAEIEQEASEAGIQKIQFNVIGQEELQLKTGYLGLAISAGENKEAISFLQTTDGLEYELTSLIRQVSLKEKKTIAFLAGHGEYSLFENYQILGQELSKQYIVRSLTLSEEDPVIDDSVDLLVIPNPSLELSAAVYEAIGTFAGKGKGVVFMLDRYVVGNDLAAVPNVSNVFALVQDLYGVTVENNLVYDLRFNDKINLQEGLAGFVIKYPLWLRAEVAPEGGFISSKSAGVGMPWASSVLYDKSVPTDVLVYKDLVVTSDFAGVLSENINANPRQEFSSAGLGVKSIAVTVEPGTSTVAGVSGGKALIIGDGEFLVDPFLQRSPENLSFGLSAIAWVAGDDTMADIQLRKNVFGRFKFTSEAQPGQIKLVAFGIAVFVPVFIGLARFVRRRTLRFSVYKRGK